MENWMLYIQLIMPHELSQQESYYIQYIGFDTKSFQLKRLKIQFEFKGDK